MTLLESLAHTPVEIKFGTSGLRALAAEMTDLECYINTCGFLAFLKNTNNIVGGEVIGLAGDLRESTPRILSSVAKAVSDEGYRVEYLGLIPTPALAHWGSVNNRVVIMVTGSHIPADRNGIKYYKRDGEVLKPDEVAIKTQVAKVRQAIYSSPAGHTPFAPDGSLRERFDLPVINKDAEKLYLKRYLDVLDRGSLAHKTVVVYQQSAVARDLLVKLFKALGANVIAVGRARKFIPIDTENVTQANRTYFKSLAKRYSDSFAIISADGDSDRPFVIDEVGNFHRGDVLGAVVAGFIEAKSAAVPISASDAVDKYLNGLGINLVHTKVGSPYVIVAMAEAVASGAVPAVGWEVNGGFLTGSEVNLGKGTLSPLPTRDAFLPILAALLLASRQMIKLSELFAKLPVRFTQAGLIDNFPSETSQHIIRKFGSDTPKLRHELSQFFSAKDGFGKINKINSMDGIRIYFDNGDIAHIRPSGNAPQLRIYSVAHSQNRADQIVSLALDEPGGILRRIEHEA